MKAIGYTTPGDADVLQWLDLPDPTLEPRDILVRVEAVSINPADTGMRRSKSGDSGKPVVLGYDAVGTVVRGGREATLFKEGDRVFYAGSMSRDGSDAELQAVDERIVGRAPTSISKTDAAALPLTALTAWEMLFDRMHVPYGPKLVEGTLLIINGAGGVGSILTQLARRLTGLTVVATASRPETIAWCEKMGAHHVIDHHKPLDEALKHVGIGQAEYVAGLTKTAAHADALQKLIAPQGVIALIDDAIDIEPFKTKAVTIAWELMFTRSYYGTKDIARQGQILNEVASLVDAGLITSTATMTLGALTPDTLREGHELSESGKMIGKIVLPGIDG